MGQPQTRSAVARWSDSASTSRSCHRTAIQLIRSAKPGPPRVSTHYYQPICFLVNLQIAALLSFMTHQALLHAAQLPFLVPFGLLSLHEQSEFAYSSSARPVRWPFSCDWTRLKRSGPQPLLSYVMTVNQPPSSPEAPSVNSPSTSFWLAITNSLTAPPFALNFLACFSLNKYT